MGIKTPETNHPPDRRTAGALQRRDKLIAMFVAEGMAHDDAKKRAQEVMSDNGKGDWRRG